MAHPDAPRVLPCVICGRTLERAMPGERDPYQGTVFTSRGNYGSTVFDDDQRFLRIHICDDCLTAAASTDRVEVGAAVYQPTTVDYKLWTVDDENELYEQRRGPETEARP